MLAFKPPPSEKKRGKSNDDDTGGNDAEQEENCNLQVSSDYSDATRQALSVMNEKELSFELIESLLKYIGTLGIPGAVLVFLPGWNLIFALHRHLTENHIFGEYRHFIESTLFTMFSPLLRFLNSK